MLRPKKHISKKKIKEDQFVIRTMQTADWLKQNQTTLIIGAVVLVVGILAFLGWKSSRSAAEEEASVLVLQGGYSLQAGDSEGARPVLLRAVNRYPGTRAAGRAAFMLGQVYFQEGEVDSARTYYQRVLDEYSSDDLTRSGAAPDSRHAPNRQNSTTRRGVSMNRRPPRAPRSGSRRGTCSMRDAPGSLPARRNGPRASTSG